MITNFIDHEYIEKSFFYLIEDSCKNLSMYLYGRILNGQTYHYPNRLLVTIYFVTRCAQNYFIILFILCMQSCNNNIMTFFMYNLFL
jgi:hypothetical protein